MYSCMKMGKWDLLNMPGIGGEGIKENDGGNEFNYDTTMIYCKNFCKCHNVLPVQQ
jgi:hypothetical protein